MNKKTPLCRTSKKLIPKFIGPYQITKVNDNKTIVRDYPGGQTQFVHVNRLKPFCESMIWDDVPGGPFDDVRNVLPSATPSSLTLTSGVPLPPVTDSVVTVVDLKNFDDSVNPSRTPTPSCSPILGAQT